MSIATFKTVPCSLLGGVTEKVFSSAKDIKELNKLTDGRITSWVKRHFPVCDDPGKHDPGCGCGNFYDCFCIVCDPASRWGEDRCCHNCGTPLDDDCEDDVDHCEMCIALYTFCKFCHKALVKGECVSGE